MSVEQWLAETSGCSEGMAREALITAQRLEQLPTTAERVREGTLSIAQAAQVSAGAAADPGAEQRLLTAADRTGMRGLRAEKERVIHAATDEDASARLAHRERHLRTWNRGAATHGSFSGPLKIAIAERDQTCRIRGCDCDRHLHRHHTEAFARSQRTTYRELGNLCPRHHHLVHDEGYEIVVHADGTWDLRAPPGEAAA